MARSVNRAAEYDGWGEKGNVRSRGTFSPRTIYWAERALTTVIAGRKQTQVKLLTTESKYTIFENQFRSRLMKLPNMSHDPHDLDCLLQSNFNYIKDIVALTSQPRGAKGKEDD